MTVLAEVEAQIADALRKLQQAGRLPAELALGAVEVEPTKDPRHGDLATNAAMVLAKPARMKPRDIADALVAELAALPGYVKVEVAGPGFVNISLAPDRWQSVIADVRGGGERYGASDLGKGEKLLIEYVSANPTGPMHVGHGRGAVFGDSLANLLAFAGYAVTREYYVNDAGAQVDVLARSAFLRYREALGEDIGEIPAGLYPGDYLKPVGAALAKKFGDSLLKQSNDERAWLPIVRAEAIAAMLVMIKEDLAALDIRHEVFFSERSLTEEGKDEIAETIAELRAKGLVFEGRLERPKGHDADDWEDREQTLFKSTDFGDDVDRALMKSDGSYTYFAGDMAYHHNKLARGFRHLINVFGADHTGYIKRMQAAVAALSGGKADLDIKVCQLVRLLRGGEPVKMSKRAGTFVTLREVVDEVGSDPIRFMMLYRKNDAALDFDLAKVVEKSKDNPVFYVQYAHARAHSIFRNAAEAFSEIGPRDSDVTGADTSLLTDDGELDLLRRLALFPRTAEGAARAHEPHRIAFYLSDLASAFHAQWTRGNDSPHLRFIQPNDRKLTAARLALVGACAQVIATGLAILGVHAPIEMR
ncbi:MAG TPA: arginine--tRNA ligase [Hyphomicrobiaceae bacterium]|nr:arginine--tRNA ligase [Hyphomicrobiaceae bacterium]